MRLKHITQKSRRISVDYSDEQVEIEYRPHAVNVGLLGEMKQRDDAESLIYQTVAVIKRWDILDDDDQEMPVTEENARIVPLDFLAQAMQAITKDLEGWSKEEKKRSGAGS